MDNSRIEKCDYIDNTEKAHFENNMSEFFIDLDREQGKAIENAKGVRGKSTKETIIFELLTTYYSKIISKIVEPTIEEPKEVA